MEKVDVKANLDDLRNTDIKNAARPLPHFYLIVL